VIKLPIKPLSVNQAFRAVGSKMLKSREYNNYSKKLPLLLPPMHQLPPDELVLIIKFYFATKASDIDNPIKPMQDLICDYYGVNDNKIYMLLVEKHTGHKGNERIEFEFLQYSPDMFDKCREAIINCD